MNAAMLPVLFASSDNLAVVQDPVNEEWVAIVATMDGPIFEMVARRYYEALYHFRSRPSRSALPGVVELVAETRQQAFEGMLNLMEQRKAERKLTEGTDKAMAIFVDPNSHQADPSLPASLRDFSLPALPLGVILAGRGRPPCDALCLLRAFITAPFLGVGDGPTAVHRLLHSNPTFAHLCGFMGGTVLKEPNELTSRRLPSEATCEEFSEIMTRYGLWHLARLGQVRDNIARGVVQLEDTLSFDTTHIEANSHCGNVVPAQTEPPADDEGKQPRQRKVPRMHKTCSCGRDKWEGCEHPWSPTDHGAAVVVKGPSRIYWAHKASIAVLAQSEIPLDARVLLYAADSDGKTLLPHLKVLQTQLPEVLSMLRHILADDAYRNNHDAVKSCFDDVRLTVPVHPRHVSAELAASFAGIVRFTDVGVPICQAGHPFELRGRDLSGERYIWTAPDGDDGRPVCASCPQRCTNCDRRHIRVHRDDLPQIDWEHPQHFARNITRYGKRTGVERAIKRLKVDLGGENLTHRDALRVQGHLDRKLLALHLLLAVNAAD